MLNPRYLLCKIQTTEHSLRIHKGSYLHTGAEQRRRVRWQQSSGERHAGSPALPSVASHGSPSTTFSRAGWSDRRFGDYLGTDGGLLRGMDGAGGIIGNRSARILSGWTRSLLAASYSSSKLARSSSLGTETSSASRFCNLAGPAEGRASGRREEVEV
uniref:Uncharacterized protein n=1 Tax=Arundo donax TaxID=35708 RepID=A0A0A8ZQU0_ARUDO